MLTAPWPLRDQRLKPSFSLLKPKNRRRSRTANPSSHSLSKHLAARVKRDWYSSQQSLKLSTVSPGRRTRSSIVYGAIKGMPSFYNTLQSTDQDYIHTNLTLTPALYKVQLKITFNKSHTHANTVQICLPTRRTPLRLHTSSCRIQKQLRRSC